MKKALLLCTVCLASCLSSFGQGYFVFANSGSSAVIDGFTAPGTYVKSPANVMVGILYSTSATSLTALGGSPSGSNTVSTASWSQIMADPNWHLAQSGGAALTALTRTGLSLGTFNGGTVGIDGTSAGQVISLYVVAWRASDGVAGFGTSSVLGWSNPISETLGGSSAPGLTLAGSLTGPIGVSPTTAVPEPASFALAGLGAAALMVLRRRK